MRILHFSLLLLFVSFSDAESSELTLVEDALAKHREFISNAYCGHEDFTFYFLKEQSECISAVSSMVETCYEGSIESKFVGSISGEAENQEFGVSLARCVFAKQFDLFQEANCPSIPLPASSEELEKVVKTEKDMAGSHWTKNLDCRYLSPPDQITVFNQNRDAESNCERVTHNINVIVSGCNYLRSQGTLNDGPVWCLVKNTSPKNIGNLGALKNTYCK